MLPWYVDHWGSHPGYACVIGYDDARPVGFVYGAPAAPGREWWREHLSDPPTDDSAFAVSELTVRTQWQKTGTAERLHEALIENRPEALAALLVDPGHPKGGGALQDVGVPQGRQPPRNARAAPGLGPGGGDGSDDFEWCDGVLRARSGDVNTRHGEGFTGIEERDPSSPPVLVAYPGPDEIARLEIISRIYV
ncbi:hypothetical protein AB0G85_32610 [Streptomyces sioyaensis]|uniref:hypothetical protein n=1 Tax=Streptomyces sioyaensis TaxID=67364 RepID=UPI0033CCC0C9